MTIRGTTRDHVAREVGLGSGKTYERGTKLLADVARRAPELLAGLADGTVEGRDAAKELRAQDKRDAEAKVAAQLAQAAVGAVVHHADAVAWLATQEPASVDLLLTDPPYSTDVADISGFVASWVPVALQRLKSTGRAYICTGSYPDELVAYLTVIKAAGYSTQVLVWHYADTMGPRPRMDYKTAWQAVLHVWSRTSSPLDCPLLTELQSVWSIPMNSGVIGGRLHRWQKPDSLGERIVRHASRPGDVVADPFAGTGTFLLAAAKLGRAARGAELDETMLATAVQRGCTRA